MKGKYRPQILALMEFGGGQGRPDGDSDAVHPCPPVLQHRGPCQTQTGASDVQQGSKHPGEGAIAVDTLEYPGPFIPPVHLHDLCCVQLSPFEA